MQVEHKTEKGTVLFVKVPDDAWDFTLTTKGTPAIYFQTRYLEENKYDRVIIDSFGWQLIGLTSEITENQARDMFRGLSTGQLDGIWYSSDNGKTYSHETTLSVLKHIMQKKKVYEVNPYGEKPKRQTAFMHQGFYSQNDLDEISEYEKELNEWQEAQQITGRWLVLFKPKEK